MNRYFAYGKYTRDEMTWSVPQLYAHAIDEEYEQFDLPLKGIHLGTMPWKIDSISEFIAHIEGVNECDLSYPILLDDEGYICDGWHRVVRAILEGKTTIKAIKLEEMP